MTAQRAVIRIESAHIGGQSTLQTFHLRTQTRDLGTISSPEHPHHHSSNTPSSTPVHHHGRPLSSWRPRSRPGTPTPDPFQAHSIIGIPLNGAPGVQAVPDTDGGVLDGDTAWDRAVGLFQFIPGTWARWKADGNGDRIADLQNIDDAAVAAGRYLCAGGRNRTDGAGWWSAILNYNNSNTYVQNMFNGADSHARAAIR
ncbi:MAG: lytic murein transglycosylase [Mycobacteriaceae bacterium]